MAKYPRAPDDFVKACTRCGERKPATAFHSKPQAKGRHSLQNSKTKLERKRRILLIPRGCLPSRRHCVCATASPSMEILELC